MKLYSENDSYKIYNGDMLDMLQVIKPESIDAIICDPPYELGFMNKSWDSTGIAFKKETWQNCFEVLKPGGYLLAFGGSRTYHRIACAIEDAGFEIRDCVMYLYGCYSSDTQVLTNEGWKYFYELNKTEKVLQWDKDNDKLSWIKPLNYFEYNIDDELILLQNRHTEQLITKNHKVVCDIKKDHKQYHNKYDYIEAQKILKSDFVKLPLASYYYGSLHYKYAYIIGWFLTDAWIHKDGKAVCFSQSKKDKLVKLKNELERLKEKGLCKYSEYIRKSKKENQQEEHSFYVTGKIANYLINEFPNREFKEEFIELDKESKDKLLEGLIDGDGSSRENSYSHTFWSKKDFRNNILSAMLTTMGYRNYISYNEGHKGVVFNTKHQTTEIQYKHKKENVKYSGKVYCLQTETGAFVVRRKGKPFISGNSGFPKSKDIAKALEGKLTLGSSNPKDFKKLNGEQVTRGNWGYATMQLEQGYRNKNYDTEAESETYLGKLEPTTDLAKEWQGWGTCLKPAYEPIIVARKPFKGSVVDNIIKYRVGGININGCKIGNEKRTQFSGKSNGRIYSEYSQKNAHFETVEGRFPANVITDGSEEVAKGMPNTTSTPIAEESAMRYFYSAKASKKDRDEGLDAFEERKTTDGCIRANVETARNFGANSALRKNIHPTCKPTELMQYLVRLVSPKGATILDPFMGSGSTGKAVMFENRERDANYKFIGIELTDEYLPIAQARIEYARDKFKYDLEQEKVTKGKQNIFDFMESEE
jgi:site-specific DNA-methyltransferase (adenine-specific)